MLKMKRCLSFLLVIVMLVSAIQVPVSAAEVSPLFDNLQAEFKIINEWEGYYNAEIVLTNIGNKTIENWMISFVSKDEIENIWNGEIVERAEEEYIIKNLEHNANIASGASITFGFTAKASGEEKGVTDIQLLDNAPAPITEDFEIIFTTTSDWGDGYSAQIEIKNNTDKRIENWKLEFDFDKKIDNIWNAEILQYENNHYIIGNVGHNINVPANGSVIFGFGGSPGNIKNEPENYVLSSADESKPSEKSVITIDTTDFETTEEIEGIYSIEKKINTISGTLTNPTGVSTMNIKITCGNLELVNAPLTPAGEWSYAKPNLPMGLPIKVIVSATLKDKSVIEESIILFNSSDENFDESLLDTADNDGDRLPNWLEDIYGTDKNNADTDGDGLTDYEEISITYTNPLLYDTGNEGMSDGEKDPDGDSLTNIQECQYGTEPYLADTDYDGLSDYDEIFTYKTDPLKADTDEDGLPDNLELEYDMDPNNQDTLNDGTLDGDRIFTVRKTSHEWQEGDAVKPILEIELMGKQIESLCINKVADTDLFLNPDVPGYVGNAYDFNVDGTFESATLTYEFDETLLENSDFVPTIYYWNEEIQLLEELPNQVRNGNQVSVSLEHFSSYIMLNKKPFDAVWQNEIKPSTIGNIDLAIVIDNSGSMDKDSSPKNDKDQLRLVVAKDLIDKLGANDRACVIHFATNVTVQTTFTADKAAAKKAVDTFTNGGTTKLYDAINVAHQQFSINGDLNATKIIIVLTDGADNNSSISLSTLINTVKSQDVRIYTIGLGSSVNTNALTSIANATLGEYYHASKASDMFDIFDQIAESDLLVDTDKDELPDYFEKLINDGTLTLGNGVPLWKAKGAVKLSIENPSNKDSDGDGLTDGEEVEIFDIPNDNGTYKVWVKIKSNPCLKYTVDDGKTDAEAPEPLVWTICDRNLAMAASMSYSYLPKGKTLGDLSSYHGEINGRFNGTADVSEMKDWLVLDSYSDSFGMQVTAFKRDDKIIIAYRGTEPGSSDDDWEIFIDRFGTDLVTFVTGFSNQVPQAKYFIVNVIKNNPGCKFYVTGHSLGGHLAYNGGAAGMVYKNSAIQQVVTFNGLGLALGRKFALDEADAVILLLNAEKITNYSVKGDMVAHFPLGWYTTHVGRKVKYDKHSKAPDKHSMVTFFLHLPRY